MADTIKAVRETIAKNLAAQLARDAAQDERIRTLETKVAALSAPAPVPAPAPAPAPLPSPPATTGLKGRAELPATVTLFETAGGTMLMHKAATELAGFDLSGLVIAADNSAPLVIHHSKLHPPPTRSGVLGLGMNFVAGAVPDVTFEDNDVDLTNPIEGWFNGVICVAGSLTSRRNRWRNASVVYINFSSPLGFLTVEYDDFGSPGVNTHVDANPDLTTHVDTIAIFGAQKALIRHCRLDAADGAGRTKFGTGTSHVLVQGRAGPVDALLEDNDFLNPRIAQFGYCITATAPKFPTKLAMINNRMMPGLINATAYATREPEVAVTASGNTDAITGASIDALLH